MHLQLPKTAWLLIFLINMLAACSGAENRLHLENDFLKLSWEETADGWRMHTLEVNAEGNWLNIPNPLAAYTLLYSSTKPDSIIDSTSVGQEALTFPGPDYFISRIWKENLSPTAMNTTGEVFNFFPEQVMSTADSIVFQHTTPVGTVQAVWYINPAYPHDVMVHLELTPSVSGYFSLASPTLYPLSPDDIRWGMIPGLVQGKNVQENLVLAYAYGQGIPNKPVVFRDRTASTLSPMLTDRQGITQAVIPAPGYARDPWAKDEITQNQWKLGLSLMNREKQFAPTLYHPVLGKDGSSLEKGEKLKFNFRYVVRQQDWFQVLNHAIYDVYQFDEALALRKNKRSLTNRMLAMHDYVTNDQTS